MTLNDRLAIIDLETTGTAATADRITEIGIVRVEHGKVVEEWSTLVNPQGSIPLEIQALTGITDAMVKDAPTFEDIHDEVLARLQGHLFVAHNARFDYGFIKNELRRLEMPFSEEVLCTVRLSRRLYPEASHHNLDALVARHGLEAKDRHRALGDARLAWQFLQVVQREKTEMEIAAAIKALLKMPSLPPQLAADALANLPEGPGVYVFYGVNDLPIYVGKSINLRDRVRSHFSSDYRNAGDLRLSQEIRRIDFEETAGELGALLRESQLVKQSVPLHNRRLRRNAQMVFICVPEGDSAPQIEALENIDFAALEGLYGPFPAKARAKELLLNLAHEFALCWKALGLQKIAGPCFARQIHRCAGACVGAEGIAQHHERLKESLAPHRFQPWPYPGPIAICETHPDNGWRCAHVFNRWRHLGTARSNDEVHDIAQLRTDGEFDPDAYRILSKHLEKHPRSVIVLAVGGDRPAKAQGRQADRPAGKRAFTEWGGPSGKLEIPA